MAQAQHHHLPEKETTMILQEQSFCFNKDSSTHHHHHQDASFRFNVDAPEFVPRPPAPVPISGYFVPCFPFMGTGGNGGDWIFLGEQDALSLVSNSKSNSAVHNQQPKTAVLTEELQRKILKQMEYQFSDMSLLANDNLAKQISKDPEGYVPIANVSSTKKIKSLVGSNHALLAQALKTSTKLDVSSDMKRVKRKVPFTDKVKEELQLRTIVAENLPDDHSHQNIEKIFNVAGSVKTIRICHPQDPNNRSKGDFIISTKLHALVEFENSDSAERAVEKLNDQKNWRKGLRVRCLLRRSSPKSVLKTRKSEFDGIFDDCESPPAPSGSPEAPSPLAGLDLATEINEEEFSGGSNKMWGKGRTSKPRHRLTSSHSGRGLLSLSPQHSFNLGEAPVTRQTVKGPKMPDGTRGFTMGRGKPLASSPPVNQACQIVV
ncbi:OLC1v1003039C1 [Oldenlandia corymbosa var. corymbosa]|uniref:OLC1v1003039C1 n=1 Tax=Oldenlandia corymbosa var. corymbosa TaxID=529605 RepID=A0AAV1D941_OLDCO|nr:OLC1v1003039C1 [Oldenlandia corymbosa var. corymbosa]